MITVYENLVALIDTVVHVSSYRPTDWWGGTSVSPVAQCNGLTAYRQQQQQQQPPTCGRFSVAVLMNFELRHSSLIDSQLLSTTLNLGSGFSTPTHTFFTHIHHTFPGPWLSFLSPPIFLLFNLALPFAPLVITAQSNFSSSSLIAAIFPTHLQCSLCLLSPQPPKVSPDSPHRLSSRKKTRSSHMHLHPTNSSPKFIQCHPTHSTHIHPSPILYTP